MHYLVGGDGSFGDAVDVAGWAYAPETLAIPIKHVLVRREAGRLSFDGADSAALQAQFEAVQDPSGVGWTLPVLLTVAWSVFILAHGTARHPRRRDRDRPGTAGGSRVAPHEPRLRLIPVFPCYRPNFDGRLVG